MKSRGINIDFDGIDNSSNAELISNELDTITKELGKDFESVYSYEQESALLGKSFSSMKQTETRKEFEKEVKVKFHKIKLPKPYFILENVSY